MRILLSSALAVATILLAAPACALERVPLGWSLAISNDSMGDWRDRWQSSSVQYGFVVGKGTDAPARFGDLLEYRFRTEILTPEDLDEPAPDDRRHAGVLSFGVHSYRQTANVDARIGADIVVIGAQTGLLSLQTQLHELLGFTIPDLDDFKIDDTARLDLSGEVALRRQVGALTFRPFAEAQAGTEDLIRIGFDIGTAFTGAPFTRAAVTGHPVPLIGGQGPEGFSFAFGADAAWVADSVYLPEGLGYDLTDARLRARGGVHWNSGRWSLYYGLTWLGEEFEAQREAQFVGIASAAYRF